MKVPGIVKPFLPLLAQKLIADMDANKKNLAYTRAQEAEAKTQARRAAIERAMGGSSLSRIPKIIEAPDTSREAIISNLIGLGTNIATQKYL